MVRRRIEQTRPFQHAGREGEPNRVPVRLNLARCRPARTGSAVKFLERGRIQKQRLQRHRFPFNSMERLPRYCARAASPSQWNVPVTAAGRRKAVIESLTLLTVANLRSPEEVKIRRDRWNLTK